MLTGDNAQCAHYIARQSNMVSEAAQVLLADVTPGGDIAWAPLGPEPIQHKPSAQLSTAQVGFVAAVLVVLSPPFAFCLQQSDMSSYPCCIPCSGGVQTEHHCTSMYAGKCTMHSSL